MASSLALRRSASLFRNLLISHARATPAASRFFNTNAQMTTFDDDDRRDVDVDRRSDRSVNRRGDSFFPGSLLFYSLRILKSLLILPIV